MNHHQRPTYQRANRRRNKLLVAALFWLSALVCDISTGMEEDGIPAPAVFGTAGAGPFLAVVSDVDSGQDRTQQEGQEPVVVANADTGEIDKQSEHPAVQSLLSSADQTLVAAAESPSPEPSPSEAPPSQAPSSPAPPSASSPASSPCQYVSPSPRTPGTVAGDERDIISAPASPTSWVSSLAASGSSRSKASAAMPKRQISEAGDGVRKHVVIDAPEPKVHKTSAQHRRRRRPHSPPAPTVTDVLVILCGFVITLAVLSGLAASTRHLFRQKSPLVVRLHRVNQRGRLNADSFIPPTLVCGVSRLIGMSQLSSLCSHIIYTGDMDILSDGVEYTLLPADSANFDAFRALGVPGSLSPQLLASLPLAPLWERLPMQLGWHRLGRSMARLINNASIHGVEVRLSVAVALNVDVLSRLQAACKEMKNNDPDSIMFLRLRYGPLLATSGNMEKLVDCPDVVVFRTEHHELGTRVLRAPNPYRRYIGADMAELFLLQELEKISLLRKPLDGQEWCLTFALGGLLFRYHLGLSFGDDAQTGPHEISLSEICKRFSVRRFEDLRTLSFYAMEHAKHTWVAFDDDWSLTRKATLARQREGPRMCLAVYHAELDDHRQTCGGGPAPVLRRLQSLVINGTS